MSTRQKKIPIAAQERIDEESIPTMKNAKPFERRHDLDALRAIAMLLGIVLHAALSFSTVPWTVTDSQTSGTYSVLFAMIHGFRMPLFFMLSGFFTAMLWRKRTLSGLIKQRTKRILLPLVIGCLTVVPAMWAVSYVVSQPSPGADEAPAIFAAVVTGDTELVLNELRNPAVDVNAIDPDSGSTPLCSAVFIGHTEIVKLLVDAEADANLPNRDKSTPLHIAAFMGRAEECKLLLSAGADPNAQDGSGQKPGDLLKTDFGTTNFVASSLGVPLVEQTLLDGRKDIAEQLGAIDYLGSGRSESGSQAALYGLLFQLPAFMHLWFLSFLCWLVVAFTLYAVVARVLRIERLPRWFVCSPASLLWLIPLTMLPQWFMDRGTFGPDASVGLLPMPSVLAYYAIFFFFGAIYWDMDDRRGELGRWWLISLPIALLVVFPVGYDLISGAFGIIPRFEDKSMNAIVGNLLQATFAWLMTFGSIGLCRRLLSRENKTLRYISDSSYWLYIIHLPLVILAQWLVKDWQTPALLKFAGIVVVISIFLLATYEYGVRYTAIGRMLNGPRTRPDATS